MSITVKDNQCFISKEALAITNFAAKNNSRPILTGLHIKDGLATCIDGFALAHYNVIQGKDFPECTLDIKDLKAAKLANYPGSKIKCLIVSYQDGMFIIQGQYKIITDPIQGTYPQTNQLYLSAGTHTTVAYLGLSTFVIENLLNTLKSSDIKEVALRIRTDDSNKHINVAIEYSSTKDNISLEGLIMPRDISAYSIEWKSDNIKVEESKKV